MDKLQWFKFSPSSWMMGRIQRCSEIAQGRFIRLCCSYWNHGCEMYSEDAQLELGAEVFKDLIKNRVIYTDDEYIFIRFLDDQYSDIEKTSNKGKLYALKRWKPEEYNRIMGIDTDKTPKDTLLGTHKIPNAEEIRRDKKRKEKSKNAFNIFWEKYPNKIGKKKVEIKFLKLKDDDIDKILKTIEAFVNHKPFESYNHPNPETYINQERWNDEIEPVKKLTLKDLPDNSYLFQS